MDIDELLTEDNDVFTDGKDDEVELSRGMSVVLLCVFDESFDRLLNGVFVENKQVVDKPKWHYSMNLRSGKSVQVKFKYTRMHCMCARVQMTILLS
jgi:hypothetical protein